MTMYFHYSGWLFMTALVGALLIDHLWGEPPARLHPVVWMGNYLGWAGRRVQRVAWQPLAPATGDVAACPKDYKAFWLAALYWIAGAALLTVAAWQLEAAVLRLPEALVNWVSAVSSSPANMTAAIIAAPNIYETSMTAGNLSAPWRLAGQLLGAVMLALLLKPLLAWAMLKHEVLAVDAALDESLTAGRARLSWLVSRDTTALTQAQVRESAIESLAENLNDSVVAPIFWFVLLGLPGAALYRFANTADAMWGYKGVYKGHNWEWAGKWAARADDVLSWLPARLTGLLLWWVSLAVRSVRSDANAHLAVTSSDNKGRLGWGPRFSACQLRREARKTPSPNSGWPMAAMALALNIRLGKPGVYTLNPAGSAPQRADTQRATEYASKVLVTLVIIALVAIYVIAYFGAGQA
ncbi:MAG: adenosylcobinamide-phosphate synthase CbiB [Rhodoferax sp.]|uniref:adenosylcobinamide-phosphate synthase CbiB n=1 Tax=Rhodoferax sp. TaxID=50421 RepID=UPI0026109B66|nr:adenosylcobinamide-phosphate synthase CbiB [Rhodoferax sp.]MDD2881411.1 adenosylcobinamide-phosphate synthase CbiB [Rhodoferax sp.]